MDQWHNIKSYLKKKLPGGKCRQTKECFLEICKDGLRNKEVLHEIIKRRVEPLTTIYTVNSVLRITLNSRVKLKFAV